MFKGIERRRRSITSHRDYIFPQLNTILSRASFQLRSNGEFRKGITETIDNLPSQFIDTALSDLLHSTSQLAPVGKSGLRHNSLFFLRQEPDHSTLIKLFQGTRIGTGIFSQLLKRIYPEEAESTRFMGMRNFFNEPTYPDQARKLIKQSKYNVISPATEIIARTIAHKALPALLPMPTVLTDYNYKPVGFTLDHNEGYSGALSKDIFRNPLLDNTNDPSLLYEFEFIKETLEDYGVHIFNGEEDAVLLNTNGTVLDFGKLA